MGKRHDTSAGSRSGDEYWEVAAGSTLGVALRLPTEATWVVEDLTDGRVSTETLMAMDDPPVLYFTLGAGLLNGRALHHRFVNVLGDAPEWADVEESVSFLGVFAEQADRSGRLFARHGFEHLDASVAADIDPELRTATLTLTAGGCRLLAGATFGDDVEAWHWTPAYFALDPSSPLGEGEEWGVRTEGVA